MIAFSGPWNGTFLAISGTRNQESLLGVLRGLEWLYFGIFRVLKRHLIGWKRWYSDFILKWLSNRKDSPNPIICTIYELNKPFYNKMKKSFIVRLRLISPTDFWQNFTQFFGAAAICMSKIDHFLRPPQKLR